MYEYQLIVSERSGRRDVKTILRTSLGRFSMGWICTVRGGAGRIKCVLKLIQMVSLLVDFTEGDQKFRSKMSSDQRFTRYTRIAQIPLYRGTPKPMQFISMLPSQNGPTDGRESQNLSTGRLLCSHNDE